MREFLNACLEEEREMARVRVPTGMQFVSTFMISSGKQKLSSRRGDETFVYRSLVELLTARIEEKRKPSSIGNRSSANHLFIGATIGLLAILLIIRDT